MKTAGNDYMIMLVNPFNASELLTGPTPGQDNYPMRVDITGAAERMADGFRSVKNRKERKLFLADYKEVEAADEVPPSKTCVPAFIIVGRLAWHFDGETNAAAPGHFEAQEPWDLWEVWSFLG